jgi:hypothetical protein
MRTDAGIFKNEINSKYRTISTKLVVVALPSLII